VDKMPRKIVKAKARCVIFECGILISKIFNISVDSSVSLGPSLSHNIVQLWWFLRNDAYSSKSSDVIQAFLLFR